MQETTSPTCCWAAHSHVLEKYLVWFIFLTFEYSLRWSSGIYAFSKCIHAGEGASDEKSVTGCSWTAQFNHFTWGSWRPPCSYSSLSWSLAFLLFQINWTCHCMIKEAFGQRMWNGLKNIQTQFGLFVTVELVVSIMDHSLQTPLASYLSILTPGT